MIPTRELPLFCEPFPGPRHHELSNTFAVTHIQDNIWYLQQTAARTRQHTVLLLWQ